MKICNSSNLSCNLWNTSGAARNLKKNLNVANDLLYMFWTITCIHVSPPLVLWNVRVKSHHAWVWSLTGHNLMRFIWVPFAPSVGWSGTLAAGLGGTAGTREKLAFNVGLSHYNGTTFLTEVLCLKWCDHSRIIRTLSKPRRLKIPYLPEQIPKTHILWWVACGSGGAKSTSQRCAARLFR